MTPGTTAFDRTVGDVAGAIYGAIAEKFPIPPMMLVPPITFKVRRVLDEFSDVTRLSLEQKKTLAEDLRVAIVPMLFSYEIEPDHVDQLAPIIEAAAISELSKDRYLTGGIS